MKKKVRRGLAAIAVAGLSLGGTALAAEAYPHKTPKPLPWGVAGYQWECRFPGKPVEVVTASVAPSVIYCRLKCEVLPCFVSGPLPPTRQIFSL
jgi:hypothetical protein